MECSVLSLKMEDLIGETYFDIVGESRDNGKRFATTKSSHCRYKRCRCRTAQSAAEDILRRGEGGMRLSRGEARQKADRGKNPHVPVLQAMVLKFCPPRETAICSPH